MQPTYVLSHILPIVDWPDYHQVHLLGILKKFGSDVEKVLSTRSGADSCGRNARSAYRFAPGELAGCINLALWHAVGHTVN